MNIIPEGPTYWWQRWLRELQRHCRSWQPVDLNSLALRTTFIFERLELLCNSVSAIIVSFCFVVYIFVRSYYCYLYFCTGIWWTRLYSSVFWCLCPIREEITTRNTTDTRSICEAFETTDFRQIAKIGRSYLIRQKQRYPTRLTITAR